MSNFDWWRSWHGAPMDPKWSVIAMKANVKTGLVSALAWALFDYASQNSPRGSVDGFDIETYAVYSGFQEDEILTTLQAMRDKKIITDNALTSWEKRQPKREDDSSQRVAKHRALKELNTLTDIEEEKRRRRASRNVTQCNADDETSSPASNSPSIVAEKIFQAVTLMSTFPATDRDKCIVAIQSLMVGRSNQETVDYLRPFYLEWAQVRGHSRTYCAWLYDWAVSGEIPVPRSNGKGNTTQDIVRRALERAEAEEAGNVNEK